jgi:pimeloyl-ACP methyl ester carboxylesterase
VATTDESRRVSRLSCDCSRHAWIRAQLISTGLNLYTPLQTAGDLVGLLDALNIPSAVIVGHDWGATHAWNAAIMRPDRFRAVFCLSVPYFPLGDVSVFERMRTSGHENDFYMFEQIKPEADQIWADAAITIPEICSGQFNGSSVINLWRNGVFRPNF